jgi:hypothetical protein
MNREGDNHEDNNREGNNCVGSNRVGDNIESTNRNLPTELVLRESATQQKWISKLFTCASRIALICIALVGLARAIKPFQHVFNIGLLIALFASL